MPPFLLKFAPLTNSLVIDGYRNSFPEKASIIPRPMNFDRQIQQPAQSGGSQGLITS
jgi:hypothetical protein